MAAGIKKLVKETAIYGLSNIIGRFLNWMLVPLYTRVLNDTGEYGIVTNLYGWTALLLVLLTYGMETGFFRFINRKDENDPARVYASTLYVVAFTSASFIALSLLFVNKISVLAGYADHSEYISMMACIAAIDAFCCIPFSFLRNQGKAIRFASIKLINIALNIALNLFFLLVCPKIQAHNPALIDWFYRPDYGVGYILIANVCATVLTFILLIPDMLPGLRSKFDLQLIKRMLRYSFPILILGIAGVASQTADKILFPFLFDNKEYAEAQLGIYGACFKIAVVMIMFMQAFYFAYEPFIFAKNKEANSRQSYAEAMKYFILFSLFIFTSVLFYLDILQYFIAEEYRSGLVVVPIVMLGELFFGIYYNLSAWYKLTDQTHWGAYFSIVGCLATIASILLFVPHYGFIACAWASFIGNLLMMLLSYFVGQKKYPIAYDLRSALFYAVVVAVCCTAGLMPDIESIALRLIYRTVILLIFLVIIAISFKKQNLFSRRLYRQKRP